MNIWTAAIGSNPLIRAVRHHILALQLEEQLAEIAKDTDTMPIVTSRATLAGDERKLRGIPMIGRGIGGAIPGTNPTTIPDRMEAA